MPEIKMRSLRGCPDHEWNLAVAAAGRVMQGSRKQLVGEWIAEAIRMRLAAEREPIGEIVPAEPGPAPWWQQQPLSLSDAVELSLKLADQRTGDAKGKIPRPRLAVLNRALTASIAAFDEPSNTGQTAADRRLIYDRSSDA